MGCYVNVFAKKDCAEQINELWAKQFDHHLISTPTTILGEIDYMKNDPQQAYAASIIHTVEDWNRNFTIHACDRGQIFIGATVQVLKQDTIDLLAKKVQWILDHRLLFKSIDGLKDAVEELDMAIDADAIIDGKKIVYQKLTFDELPKKPQSAVYRYLLDYGRPDIWQSYLAFTDKPTQETWLDLRDRVLPGANHYYLMPVEKPAQENVVELRSNQETVMELRTLPGVGRHKEQTIWQACEALAKQLNPDAGRGNDYGQVYKGNGSDFPSVFDVKKVIKEAAHAAYQDNTESDGPR